MANYLDPTQRREIEALATTFVARTEWPTWLLLIGVYAGWFAVILGSRWLGLWLSMLLLIPLVTLWLSVQHELLHGHPTRSLLLNKLLGYAPFAVWYPYTLYRDSHLLHHNDDNLTLPGIDPESRYLNQQQWDDSSLFERGVHWLTKTVLGRFLLAAPLAIGRLARHEFQRLPQVWPMWLAHGAVTVLMLSFIASYSALAVWHYLLLVSVPALSLASITAPICGRNTAQCSTKRPGPGPGCFSTTICTWCTTICQSCRGTCCPGCTVPGASSGWCAAVASWCKATAS